MLRVCHKAQSGDVAEVGGDIGDDKSEYEMTPGEFAAMLLQRMPESAWVAVCVSIDEVNAVDGYGSVEIVLEKRAAHFVDTRIRRKCKFIKMDEAERALFKLDARRGDPGGQ